LKDNGIGFDQKDASRIFDIFQRLHLRNEYEGSGIGLATCKKIVENHRGSIWADAKLGQGATFCFTLPLVPEQDSTKH
jgi:chemotaxis family two-component system sensor kinase Cph1